MKLIVKEILIGQYGLTQAVLVPETKLLTGLEYTLFIEKLPQGETLDMWNSSLEKYTPKTYKVVQGLDKVKPRFSAIPKEIKKTFVHYGCGPEIYVVFDCQVIEHSEYLVKTTLKNLKTGKSSSYYLKPYKGTIEVGRGMCSGAFTFDENENYEVAFSIMDASGNFTAWKEDRIKFTKPIDTNPDGQYE